MKRLLDRFITWLNRRAPFDSADESARRQDALEQRIDDLHERVDSLEQTMEHVSDLVKQGPFRRRKTDDD